MLAKYILYDTSTYIDHTKLHASVTSDASAHICMYYGGQSTMSISIKICKCRASMFIDLYASILFIIKIISLISL